MVGWSKGLKTPSKKFSSYEDASHVARQGSIRRFSKAGKLSSNPQDTAAHLRHTSYEHWCYHVDTWISRRRSQALALSALLLLSVIFFGGVWTICFQDGNMSWYDNLFEGLWIAWTFMADPGTHADEPEQPRRIVGAAIAVGGIFFMAATLSLIVDLIRAKMEAVRQGKSNVVEKGHSLILGWSEKAMALVEELCNANASEGGGTIVILSSMEKELVEKDLAMQVPPSTRMGTKVVFRSGNPMLVTDLLKAAAPTARATIILSNDGDPDNSDAETLRVMLSLRTMPYKLEGHVIAEVRDIDNEALVKMVGGSVAETVVSHDVLGRLMLRFARQPGLAKVYESLLGFEGDEFYVSEWPELTGVSFGELMERFPDAVPIGLVTARDDLILNPDPSRVVDAHERIVVIAEDDDTYQPEDPEEIEVGSLPEGSVASRSPEKILFCGWRRDIRDIVTNLDSIVELGSEIHMISASVALDQRAEVLIEEGLDIQSLKNLKLVHHFGNPSVRRRLAALPLSEFASCMIFADQAFEADPMNADSHSLATLLLLRDLQGKSLATKSPDPHRATTSGPKLTMSKKSKSTLSLVSGSTEGSTTNREDTELLRELAETVSRSCPVICEVLDPRTAKTISYNPYIQASSDFCQTNKITAQIVAMVAENRQVNTLFDELLGLRGNSVNMFPSRKYVKPSEHVSFWTLAKRAARASETLIGFTTPEPDSVAVVNPGDKNKKTTWEDYHMVVISLSEVDTMAKKNIQSEDTDPQLFASREDDINNAGVAFQGLVNAMTQKERVRFAQAMKHLKRVVCGTEDPSLSEGVHASLPRSIEVFANVH